MDNETQKAFQLLIKELADYVIASAFPFLIWAARVLYKLQRTQETHDEVLYGIRGKGGLVDRVEDLEKEK